MHTRIIILRQTPVGWTLIMQINIDGLDNEEAVLASFGTSDFCFALAALSAKSARDLSGAEALKIEEN